MKYIIVFILAILSVVNLCAEEVSSVNSDNQFTEALQAYQDGDFQKSISLFKTEIDKLEQKGEVSPELYYNLGNAYFRANEIPESLLYYERALLYKPSDRDIRHNIEYAQTKIEDKILTADTFFLSIWFNSIQNLASANAWAIYSVVFFVLFIGAMFLFFFTAKVDYKKIGFYLGVISLVLVIFMNIFAYRQREKIENRNTAIIMAGSVPIVSAPTGKSKELVTLHAGTKVKILKSDGEWVEIEISDGTIGWMEKTKLEII